MVVPHLWDAEVAIVRTCRYPFQSQKGGEPAGCFFNVRCLSSLDLDASICSFRCWKSIKRLVHQPPCACTTPCLGPGQPSCPAARFALRGTPPCGRPSAPSSARCSPPAPPEQAYDSPYLNGKPAGRSKACSKQGFNRAIVTIAIVITSGQICSSPSAAYVVVRAHFPQVGSLGSV